MNITEANDLNTVLAYMLGIRGPHDHEEPDWRLGEEAQAAAERLANRARNALDAGLDGTAVAMAWERLELPGWADHECEDQLQFDGECSICGALPERPVDDVVSDRLVDPDGAQTPDQYRRSQRGDAMHGRRT